MAQRLVRAKRVLREERVELAVRDGSDLGSRLESVLEVVYLMFNEGYNAHRGVSLIREDLCEEAVRLGTILVEHPSCDRPVTHALAALMFLQAARIPARRTVDGDLLLISEQDRTLWDQPCIQRGLHHLSRAGRGDMLTRYHIEAGVAACHTLAASYLQTDWKRILAYYDQLITMTDSQVVALNRAVAVSMVEGPEAGIAELARIRKSPSFDNYYLLHATLADFYLRCGYTDKARDAYTHALELAGSEPEQRFLARKLFRLNSNAG
jgi:RNA polymerase sigma-70 factor (ECF subfamily)